MRLVRDKTPSYWALELLIQNPIIGPWKYETERGAEYQPHTRLENQEEPTTPTPTQENEIEMQEGGVGVKRGQSESRENHSNGKLRRREGIKRGLRDILPVSYEEYDTSWDYEDQSKRCKRSVNCLLARCICEREAAPDGPVRYKRENDVITAEHSQILSLPVRGLPDAPAEQVKQAGTRNPAERVRVAVAPAETELRD